jgi:hypothetical protein
MEHTTRNPGCSLNVLPGRLRLTSPHLKGREEIAAEIRGVFENVEGITDVSINTTTGSLLVRHDEDTIETSEILALLRNGQYICKSVTRELQSFERVIIEAEEEELRRIERMDSPRRRHTDMGSLGRRRTDTTVCYMHAIPGRLRLNSDFLKGNEARAAEAREALLHTEGIIDVSISTTTGSILIHHDEDRIETSEVLKILRDSQLRCKFITREQVIEGAVFEVGRLGGKALFEWLIHAALIALGLRQLAAMLR